MTRLSVFFVKKNWYSDRAKKRRFEKCYPLLKILPLKTFSEHID